MFLLNLQTVNLFSIAAGEQPRLAQLMVLRNAAGGKVKIIEAVAPVWKRLGCLLDFDPSGQKLDLIKTNHQAEGAEVCCEEMFKYWLAGNGQPATWGTLIELLGDCGKSQLTEQIKDALSL